MGLIGNYRTAVKYSRMVSKFMDKRFADQLLSEKYVNEARDRIVKAIKEEAPIGQHFDIMGTDGGNEWGTPGELRDSIYSTTFHQGGKTQIVVKSRVEHAKYVIMGTKPHTIGVASKQWLSFWWDAQGTDFPLGMWDAGAYDGDGTSVFHPGIQPNNFPLRAWEKIHARELKLFSESVTSQFK